MVFEWLALEILTGRHMLHAVDIVACCSRLSDAAARCLSACTA